MCSLSELSLLKSGNLTWKELLVLLRGVVAKKTSEKCRRKRKRNTGSNNNEQAKISLHFKWKTSPEVYRFWFFRKKAKKIAYRWLITSPVDYRSFFSVENAKKKYLVHRKKAVEGAKGDCVRENWRDLGVFRFGPVSLRQLTWRKGQWRDFWIVNQVTNWKRLDFAVWVRPHFSPRRDWQKTNGNGTTTSSIQSRIGLNKNFNMFRIEFGRRKTSGGPWCGIRMTFWYIPVSTRCCVARMVFFRILCSMVCVQL